MHLPAAIGERMDLLASYGIRRELDRTDIPYLLSYSYPRAWSNKLNAASLATVGLNPFNRAPLWAADIQATKGEEVSAACKQFDVESIFFKLDQGKIDEASDEMVRQLVGTKWGTAKMLRFATTGEPFRRIAKLYAYTAKKRKEDAASKSAAYQQAVLLNKEKREEEKRAVLERKQLAAEKKAQKEKEVAEKKAAVAKRKAEKLAAMPTHKRIKVGIDDVSAENAAKIEAFMLSLS
eukprot:SAG11_NODE_922_length_6540_cov_45.267816_4_plen_236_part_00